MQVNAPASLGGAVVNSRPGSTVLSVQVPAVLRATRLHQCALPSWQPRDEFKDVKPRSVLRTSASSSKQTPVPAASVEDPLISVDALIESTIDADAEVDPGTISDQEPNPYTQDDAAVNVDVPEGLGEKELELLLAEGGTDLSVERVCKVFPYPLDNFQKKAVEKFLEGQSVVVCAPTGAGKTAIAEAATAAVLAQGKRVIYTTPLKALSNQKLFEMRKRFGHVRCGLQTGDTSLNTEAQVVIMTTEILRNIMYRTAEQQGKETTTAGSSTDGEGNGSNGYYDPQTGAYQGYDMSAQQGYDPAAYHGGYDPAAYQAMMGSSMDLSEEDEGGEETDSPNTGTWMTRETRLADVGLIVMDEVHYLGDKFRGSVWEEAIINCPRHIQLLCMSATVRNPDDLGGWISKEHMPCTTIKTSFRPVPLHWMHAYTAAPPRGLQLVDLLTRDQKRLNPRLDPKNVMIEEARAMLNRKSRGNTVPSDWAAMMSTASMGSSYGSMDGSWDRSLAEIMGNDPQAMRKTKAKRVPQLEPLMLRFKKLSMLPAIWFILSRKDCDLSAIRATSGAVELTSEAEQAAIRSELVTLQEDQPEAVREELVPALVRGVASHHAGHLPGWKALVEKLFQKGLLKIVFATGTLAAGINMPARTTVISAISRRTDEGQQLLPHNEMLQMAGRAGRRGYDTEGNCVVLQTRFEGPEEAFHILRAGPEPLVSHFNVSYGLVLNLLSVYSLEQAKAFCNKSFGNYLRAEGNQKRLQEIADLEARIKDINERFESTASQKVKELNERVSKAKDQLRELRALSEQQRMEAGDAILQQQALLPRQVIVTILSDKKGGRTGPQPKGTRATDLPVVLTRRILRQRDDGTTQVLYQGLGADNRLVTVNPMWLKSYLPGPDGSVDDDVAQQVDAALQRAVGWSRPAARIDSCTVAPGTSTTAMIALQIQTNVAWAAVPVDTSLNKKLTEAKNAVRDAVAALDIQRRVESGDDGQMMMGGSDDEDAPYDEEYDGRRNGGGRRTTRDGTSMGIMAQARSMQKKVDKLRDEMEAAGENTWKNFTEVFTILGQMSAVDKSSLALYPLGLVARNIQGQNELWLALVLTHPALYGLTGPELAGVLGAILCGEVVRKPGQIQAAYTASQKVVDAVNAMEGQRQLLSELQAAAGLGVWNDALLLDLRLAGIVEAWAAGSTWKQVVADSGMDDGDIARLLIRTVDLLKQLSWQKELLPHLQDACAEALRGMDRKPIAETVI